jgi:DNA polymerase (family X)
MQTYINFWYYEVAMKMHKEMTNLQITELLEAVAASYQLKSEEGNKFKVVAYQRAADAIEHLSSEAKDLWDDGKLEDVAGIGKSISSHLDEIFRTGTSSHFKEVMKDLPPAMFDLLKVTGIGPKTALKITAYYSSDFKDAKEPIKTLKRLAEEGKISKIEGLTELTEQSIIKSISDIKKLGDKRMLLNYAETLAREIIDWLIKDKNIKRADPLGSLRRRVSTIGDIDITVSAEDTEKALDRFCSFPNTTRVLERGKRSASIMIGGGRRVDIIASQQESYGSLLQHFTGSKHHNVALRELALKRNLSLSDYGIYEIQKNGKKKLLKMSTEKEFYEKIGMDLIPPEIREDQGEIQRALAHDLPDLITNDDIKSDLHLHSDFDIKTSHDLGLSSMEVMSEKASKLNYEYISFTEHNPSKSGNSSSEIVDLLKSKKEKINQLNESLNKRAGKIRKVFNSLEIDMLTEGGLPVPDEGLRLLDFAIVSIHSSFRLTREKMTQRIIRSLDHPVVRIFAHPTGRLLNVREGVEIDWEKIFDFCLKNNKWLEINASPSRLDLPDNLVREAVQKGVKLSMGTDSHHVDQMDLMKYGVSVARRGWAEKKDVVNTMTLEEFEKVLE